MRTLLDRLGPDRTVLWVDLHLTRSAWLDARAAWFNDLLRRLERQRPNLTVVDWHRVARANGIRGWDGIHYGPYGYRLRAPDGPRGTGRRGPARPGRARAVAAHAGPDADAPAGRPRPRPIEPSPALTGAARWCPRRGPDPSRRRRPSD